MDLKEPRRNLLCIRDNNSARRKHGSELAIVNRFLGMASTDQHKRMYHQVAM
jgi:hypothetical protein